MLQVCMLTLAFFFTKNDVPLIQTAITWYPYLPITATFSCPHGDYLERFNCSLFTNHAKNNESKKMRHVFRSNSERCWRSSKAFFNQNKKKLNAIIKTPNIGHGTNMYNMAATKTGTTWALIADSNKNGSHCSCIILEQLLHVIYTSILSCV